MRTHPLRIVGLLRFAIPIIVAAGCAIQQPIQVEPQTSFEIRPESPKAQLERMLESQMPASPKGQPETVFEEQRVFDPDYIGQLPRAPLAAQPGTVRDQWYLEPAPQTPIRDQWYLEPAPQTPIRDQWYLEPAPQTPIRDQWYLEPAAGEAYREPVAPAKMHDRWDDSVWYPPAEVKAVPENEGFTESAAVTMHDRWDR